jgi:2-oxoglutarate ferredoxin oxidoreductase subunit alpha
MKGNEAIAEAAIRAGCDAYFGYPITPQNEIIASMAANLEAAGGIFLQAESEVASINMCYGAAAAGLRVMSSSSGPGLSLMQEGISYAAGADLPIVLVNVQRCGPGLGGIAPSQADYFQATRGGGHGDYRTLVLAPWSVQEAADLTLLAFELADRWRMPAILLADGLLGLMMEQVSLPDPLPRAARPDKSSWTVGRKGASGRASRHITSLDLDPYGLERKIMAREERYREIAIKEARWEERECEGADLVIVAYGTSARVSSEAAAMLRAEGFKVGLFRPISLWPFPSRRLEEIASRGKPILTVEMSAGQMHEDVRMAAARACPTPFFGRTGGVVPNEHEVAEAARRALGGTEVQR